jgi:glycosyltransferase involved in cell wall biosynthesis
LKIKILHITYGFPYPPDCGHRLRDYSLLRETAARHEVHLLALLPGAAAGAESAAGELRERVRSITTVRLPSPSLPALLARGFRFALTGRSPALAPYYHAEAAEAIRRLCRQQRFDIVQLEHWFLAAYRRDLPVKAATVLSFHNIGAPQYRSMARLRQGIASKLLYLLKGLLLTGVERRMAEQFDAAITVSAAESRLLGSGNSHVIPNGVDTQALPLLPEVEGAPVLLFVGTMIYPPNAEGAVWFVHHIWPLIKAEVPAAELLLAGHEPPAQVLALGRQPDITVTGRVEKLLPLYRRARLCIVPLHAGGGTRLKILEAMALGRPVVSTTTGCAGLQVEAGKHLLIADDPGEFAASILRLLNDAGLRRRIAAEARALVVKEYDWSATGARLCELYASLGA